jgi:hypothetical protein
MRLKSVVMLCLAGAVFAGCDDDDVTSVTPPPLAGVRIVNAVAEGWALDVRAVDQVEWSPYANGLAYRNATIHFATEAGKPRQIRIFPTSTVAEVTSQILHDATLTFQPNARYTLLITGSVAANNVRFEVIEDDISPPAAGQIGVRLVNTSGASRDGYLVAAATDPVTGAPTFSNVGALGRSAYVSRTAGSTATHVTAAGSATVQATATGPSAPAAPQCATNPCLDPPLPAAGVNSAGSKFSVYVFAPVAALAATQGRPAVSAVGSTTAIWLIDRNPAD